MAEERWVRGTRGRIRYFDLEDHGFSIQGIQEWRKSQDAAVGLNDFYAAHGLCLNCGGRGGQVIGWSAPSTSEVEVASALGVSELPLYDTCPTCGGSGQRPAP